MNSAKQHSLDIQQVQVIAGNVTLEGKLVIPQVALAIVSFAHGSGSSRHSSRNRFAARYLHVVRRLKMVKLAILLFDLITREHRFDSDLLSTRLAGATVWLFQHPRTIQPFISYIGASHLFEEPGHLNKPPNWQKTGLLKIYTPGALEILE